MSVRVSFEIGHEASIRTKKTVEGFTHDWEVYVRGCEGTQLPYFVEKVVFYLHETFPNPKRVIKQPPYVVKESGYAGFVLPIEIYIKHDPKRVKFQYDLTLQTSGPAVRNLQKEIYVFRNPTEELKSCLIKGGGVIVNSNSIYDSLDSRISSEPKNELVNKPKLSGADMAMKKHRNRMDMDQRSSNSFQDLFGTPITKTNKVFSDPKSTISKDPTMTKTTTSSLNSSNSKLDKDSREKNKDKNKLSPNKEREKDREKDVDKRKSDKMDSDRRKDREEKKNKEKSRDRAHSKEKLSKRSPRPPSPKRPPSPPPPIRYKEKEEKRSESVKERERKEKSDEKNDKRGKKEKRDKEHKENRSRERDSQKTQIDHKEYKSKEKNRELLKDGESPGGGKKTERKEKKEKEKEEKEQKEKSKSVTPDRIIEKKLEKEKHKHKKKDKEKKDKDRDKKREKSKEKEKPVIRKDVEQQPPKIDLKDDNKESLFASTKIVEDQKKKISHSLFSEEHSNSSLSSKEDSFTESQREVSSLFEPTSKKTKLEMVGEKSSKKEKSKKNKDKKADKEEKRRKRKLDREQPPEEPPEKELKPEDRPAEPSDSEQSPSRPQSDLDKENQENPEEYMEVLKDLQTKIVNLRDNSELQRVVQLIAQTGRYEVSQNTFDFDLCLLEKSTVKQLQEFFASS